MAQATTIKKQKAQPITVDSIEANKYETSPVKQPHLLKKNKYYQPIAVLIQFELSKREKAFKIVNREEKSYTTVVNDALDLLLFCRGLIKEDDVVSEEIRNIIKGIYKPNKPKNKKTEKEKTKK